MTESELVRTELYELYVGWLVHTYESQGRTGRLSLGTVKKFFGVVLQLASKRCMAEGWTSPRTVHFFTCLDVRNRTECAAWAAGIKRQIDRDLFDLNVKDGSIMDFSADPIYLHDIEHMCQYWAQFSNQICVQKILTAKATWLISGRATECSWVTIDSLKWDTDAEALCIEVPQKKTAKLKWAMFVAGANRHIDFFVAFGDSLATTEFEIQLDDGDHSANWLCAAMQGSGRSGKLLGDWIKELTPMVSTLPQSPSAAGLQVTADKLEKK